MFGSRLIPAGAAVFAATWLAFATGAATQSSARIGVVDLGAVFDAHPQKAELEKNLGALEKKLNETLTSLQEQLKSQRANLELYEPNTDPHRALEKEIFGLLQEIKFEKGRADDEFATKRRKFNDQLAKQLQDEVEAFGQEQQFDAIWQRKFSVSSDALSWNSVVFAKDTVDITDRLIEFVQKKR